MRTDLGGEGLPTPQDAAVPASSSAQSLITLPVAVVLDLH